MFYGLLTPGNPIGPRYHLFPEEDKVIHAGLFFVETVLTLLVFKFEIPVRRSWSLFIVAFVGVFSAGATELIQSQVAYRQADWSDFFSDLVGILLGIIFFQYLEKRNKSLTD